MKFFDGEHVEKGARVVGCACGLRLPSLPATVFLIRALRPFFLALTVKEVCLFFLILAGALFSYEIS